ncbi:MAG TPA: phosphatidylglycerophosphatase A [Pyrinomonadaceae bacterium]|jgi:phosphatidylglycerophosphatase A|nr:phosphatidylglycerophosphatase A [Pyrinomonadaceae bacterium]
MSLKESSDELNPPVVTRGAVIARAPGGKRSASDFLSLALATCGVGYLPLAPGTWGSMVGVVLYLLLRLASLRFINAFYSGDAVNRSLVESLYTMLSLALIICLTAAGVWAATRAEKLLGRKDPGAVVVDEVAGQLITFLFIPLGLNLKWWLVLAGFLLFRAFDIWKPYPVRRLEALESGLGIMADDVLAGIYAAVCLLLLTTIYLLS